MYCTVYTVYTVLYYAIVHLYNLYLIVHRITYTSSLSLYNFIYLTVIHHMLT